MADIVYVLNGKSKYGNDEIRYSIRSLFKHGRNLGRFCVVGERPEFLNVWRHIPFVNPSNYCKDVNIAAGILLACQDPEISDPFIFLADDNFMLWNFDADRLPAFYAPMYTPNMSRTYERAVYNTGMILANLGVFPVMKFFDIHLPILIHKKCMIDAFARFNYKMQRFTVKTIYANLCDKLDPFQTVDCKIADPKQVKTCTFGFSTEDEVSPEMWSVINHLYPNPSPLEDGLERIL